MTVINLSNVISDQTENFVLPIGNVRMVNTGTRMCSLADLLNKFHVRKVVSINLSMFFFFFFYISC